VNLSCMYVCTCKRNRGEGKKGSKTFSTRASHVVTHRTTGLARIKKSKQTQKVTLQ